jgi:Tol biopolymer transport system component
MNKTVAVALVLACTALPAAVARSGQDTTHVGNGKIAFALGGPVAQDDSIMVLDAEGRGRAQRLGRGTHPAWSPDGSTIAFTDGIGTLTPTLFVMNSDGGNRRRVPIAFGGEQNVLNYFPTWSPDGTRLVFTRNVRTPGADHRMRTDVYVVGLDGENLRRLTTSGPSYAATWSPDGRRIAYLGVMGAPGSSNVSIRLHVVDEDGTDDRTLVAASREASAPRGHALIYTPAWSPDGRRIAFARSTRSQASGPARVYEIWVIDADGTGLRRLTRTAPRKLPSGGVVFADKMGPAWSPDGKQIAFVSRPNLLQVMSADGRGLRTVFRARPTGRFGGVSWQPVP